MQEGRWQVGKWFGVFGLAATASAAITGSVIGAIQLPHLHFTVWLLVGVGFVLALTDLSRGGKTPTIRRQTCATWWRTRGPWFAAIAWGIDLGIGLTTIRVTSLYWFVLAVLLLGAGAPTGALVLGAYGIGLTFGLALGLMILSRRDAIHANLQALQLSYVIRPVLAFALIIWCISTVITR
ncbi:MAG: hypothetical protein H0W90_13915 [Actinobacteria bacterium]|nr:hypothetical protein [Actinomycetota bacterium]